MRTVVWNHVTNSNYRRHMEQTHHLPA